MVITTLFIKGFITGFSIAMPIGAIDLICVRNALSKGLRSGLITGMGAAVADGIYGAIAGLSVATLTYFLLSHQVWLKALGGIFLCLLGVRSIYKFTLNRSQHQIENSETRGFITCFLLAITSPVTLLSIVGIYAVMGIGTRGAMNYQAVIPVTLGVFLGSTAWWILLSSVAALFSDKVSRTFIRWLNGAAGILLILIGFVTISTIFYSIKL